MKVQDSRDQIGSRQNELTSYNHADLLRRIDVIWLTTLVSKSDFRGINVGRHTIDSASEVVAENATSSSSSGMNQACPNPVQVRFCYLTETRQSFSALWNIL